MRAQEIIFARPVKIEELETRFKTALIGVANFFTDSCCIIDTQPPLPPGN